MRRSSTRCGHSKRVPNATKDIAAKELVDAVRKVAVGGTYVTDGIVESVVRQLNGSSEELRHASLTDRELEVLRLIATGQRLTEIGNVLHISVKTVSTYKTRIQEKLQVSSTAEMIRYALENRINDPCTNDPCVRTGSM
jgi:DNA-binding NarL/FixJ family response regulator